MLTEAELTKLLKMMHAVHDKLGIHGNDAELAELADLELPTHPEEVLAEIAKLQARAVRSL